MKKNALIFTVIIGLTIGGIFLGNKIVKNETLLNSTDVVLEDDNLLEEESIEKKETIQEPKLVQEKVVEEDKFKDKEIKYISKDVNSVHIPILMYHSISDEDPKNNLLVPVKQFEDEMRWLSENGFTPMTMEDVMKSFETGKVPEKPVAITFDDGYMNNYTSAYPIMKKYNMKGTFFVITDGIDGGYYMASDMLKEMKNYGMQIENHTSNHLELNRLSKEDQISSIRKGQEALKNKLGIDSKFLCYPVGKYNDTTLEVLKELGVKLAVTTKGGQANLADGNLTLDRLRISPMSIESYASMLQNNN